MMELPKIYTNNKSKKTVKNREFFSSKNTNDNLIVKNTNSYVNTLLIKKKINDIFNSPNFVYKIKAKIKFKNGESKYVTMIAKSKDSILTFNNENILIKDILDISL